MKPARPARRPPREPSKPARTTPPNIIGERLLGLPREPSFDTDKPFREVLRDADRWR